MPTLSQSLSKYDLAFLRHIARVWGLESPKDKKTAVEQLAARISNPEYNQLMLQSLPPEARSILEDLAKHQGRLPSAVFARKYGEIRQVGAGKREREAIWDSPQNTAESLWFSGLIFLDFFEGTNGIEEFVYLPSDLLSQLPFAQGAVLPQFDTVLPPESIASAFATEAYLSDDLCTLLAWLRKNQHPLAKEAELKKHLLLSSEHLPGIPIPLNVEFILKILIDTEVITASYLPLPEPTRRLLSLGRWERLVWLYEAWLRSTSLNELGLLSHIELLGEWKNDPPAARLFLINQLRNLQVGQWYELAAFVQYIHDQFPDFQRPGGNYEVWLIRRRSDGKFLRGFESWFEVEGELLRFLILGPLLWFGLVEVGVGKAPCRSYAFRVTQQGNALLQKQAISPEELAGEAIQVSKSGVVSIPRLFAPTVRYQVARFCEWEGYCAPHYLYRITPSSLQQAQRRNLKPQQLLRLLQRHSAPLPPSLVKAVRRWMVYATEIELVELPILRVRSPELLERIRNSPCAKYLHLLLNSTTAVVRAGQEKHLMEQLAELGFLVEAKIQTKAEPGTSPTSAQPGNLPPSEEPLE